MGIAKCVKHILKSKMKNYAELTLVILIRYFRKMVSAKSVNHTLEKLIPKTVLRIFVTQCKDFSKMEHVRPVRFVPEFPKTVNLVYQVYAMKMKFYWKMELAKSAKLTLRFMISSHVKPIHALKMKIFLKMVHASSVQNTQSCQTNMSANLTLVISIKG